MSRFHFNFFQLLPIHFRVLHSLISVDFPGQSPPVVSFTTLIRVLFLEPTPHVVEHCPWGFQSPQMQSKAEIANGIKLHGYCMTYL